MRKRRIINKESTSVGKTTGHNDDAIYIGENFAAVIDGVSNKSLVKVEGREIKVAEVITEALRKIDRPFAPTYAKTLTFQEFVKYINMYIRKYFERLGVSVVDTPLEATGTIYSKYYNQIWVVGDCAAIYDGNVISNELKIDTVYANLRARIINALLEDRHSVARLCENDISKDIIENPELVSKYVLSKSIRKRILTDIQSTMHRTLIECGFSEKEIKEEGLLQRFSDPRKLQQYLKNNPNAGEYGYAVFNGIDTEVKNCIVRDLPETVTDIKLFSDGFPISVMNDAKDLGYAIRQIRKRAFYDPLSISGNKAVKAAIRQSKHEHYLAIDDASAVNIGIKYVEERVDER